MKGYLRVACVMPNLRVGNSKFNTNSIIEELLKANSLGAKLCVLPELCITGANLNSLYKDKNIINDALKSLFTLLSFSIEIDMVIIVSLPFLYENRLYEMGVAIKSGKILGMVPKVCFDNSDINYRYFSNITLEKINYSLYDNERNISYTFTISSDIIFENELFDFYISFNESNLKNINNIIVTNIACIPETIDVENRFNKINYLSKKHNSILITSTPGPSESSSYNTYFGRSLICECGEILLKNDILTNHILVSDIDLDKLSVINSKENNTNNFISIPFSFINYMSCSVTEKLYRTMDKTPYINKRINSYNFSMHIINILAVALAKRVRAINASNLIIGVSGGIDSTFAVIVAKKTIEFLAINNENIKCISMPCFGTSSRSSKNLSEFIKSLDLSLQTIDIKEATLNHLHDINHDINDTNTTYENAQARERTKILMDIANDCGGIVVGTSDLSEITLGYSTYNGDHMSMYNVNGAIPKTLMKYILNSIAEENLKTKNNVLLANSLKSIINSPISPELLPTENDLIIQKTEDIVGSYLIHDFILYNYLKYNYDNEKLYDLTVRTFIYQNDNRNNEYTEDYIRNCINIFFNRMYKAAYKRSTAPDSPDIGLPNINKNTGFIMPNDLEVSFEL